MGAYGEGFPSTFNAVIESPIFPPFGVYKQVHTPLIGEFVLLFFRFGFVDLEVGQWHDGNWEKNTLVTVNYTVSYRQIPPD